MRQDDQARVDSLSDRVASTQLLFLVICMIGSFGVLLAAVWRTGDLAAVLDPGLERLGDPKDSLPPAGPDSLWNPLLWVFEISRVAAMYVYPLVIAALVVGVPSLIRTWRIGDRRTFARLAVHTGSWLALGALALSPYGTQLHHWLLD
ncbi:hypothetical protein [Micromonospora sp. RTGN7]|uniref:hypothetical protein n=1 Tax=Micromonospora sp. RTGN7 TaxID=3016526 RepID=UPI0029FF11BD|nr:hypothetical protein [Micromonospora sp. RTGN7]